MTINTAEGISVLPLQMEEATAAKQVDYGLQGHGYTELQKWYQKQHGRGTRAV